jgi:hypothetical protein
MVESSSEPTSEEGGYFEAYASFARTLRTWLVAYGVGGPALLLTQESLAAKFIAAPKSQMIIVLFLAGVGLQVVGALLYKTAMWYLYMGEGKPSFKSTRRHRASDWISEAFLVESALDLGSIAAFGWATYLLLQLFAVQPAGSC